MLYMILLLDYIFHNYLLNKQHMFFHLFYLGNIHLYILYICLLFVNMLNNFLYLYIMYMTSYHHLIHILLHILYMLIHRLHMWHNLPFLMNMMDKLHLINNIHFDMLYIFHLKHHILYSVLMYTMNIHFLLGNNLLHMLYMI